MLLVFVNKERNKVLCATYNYHEAIDFVHEHKSQLAERYFDDVEIWEVEE